MLLRNDGNYLSLDMVSHCRGPESFLFMLSTNILYASHFAQACDVPQLSYIFNYIALFLFCSFILSLSLFDFSCTLLLLFPLAFFHSACFLSSLSFPTFRLSCHLSFFPSINLSVFSPDLWFSFDAVDSLTLICRVRHYEEMSRLR
jgi:hypothetical protein